MDRGIKIHKTTKMKVLINSNKKRFLWKAGDLHTEEGTIKESEIKKKSYKVKTNIKKELIKFDASFTDIVNDLTTGPATINAKDAGSIIAHTGINSKSKIVDAGSGSGILAAYLSNITDNITTYESNKKHFEIAKKNLKKINPKVKVKHADISKGILEKNLNLITLDLQITEKMIKHAENSLVSGGFLVCYIPNINQVQELIKATKPLKLLLETVFETIEREWVIHGLICRPKHQMLGHTGFLAIFRKY